MLSPVKFNETDFEKLLRKVTNQSALIFLGKIIAFISGFFSSIILARILGATLLGRYQLGLIIIQIFSIFCVAGLDQGLIRFIPIFELNDIGRVRKLILQNIYISFVLSIIFGIILYLFSSELAQILFHSYEMAGVLKAFGFYLPVFSLFRVTSASLIGFKRIDVESNIKNIIIPLLFILCLGLISIFGGKLYHTIFFRVFTHLVAIVFIIGYILKKYSYVFSQRSISINLKEYFSFSFPLLLIGLLYFLIGQTDILMIGYFLDEYQVGIYSVVVKISMFTILGLEIMGETLAPNFSELRGKNDIQTMELLLKIITKWVSYLSLLIFFVIVIFRIEILKIFGANFLNGAIALVILSTGQLVNSFAGPTGKLLIMTGKQKWEVFNTISLLSINILLNLFLIPQFGINGAAMATAISISVINMMKIFETFKEFRIHPYSLKYYKGILAVIFSAVITFFLRHFLNLNNMNYLLIIIVGTLLFFLISILAFYFLKLDQEDTIIIEILTKFYKMFRF